jgi:hypothetical protein
MSEQLSPFVAGLVKLQKDIEERGAIMSFRRAVEERKEEYPLLRKEAQEMRDRQKGRK